MYKENKGYQFEIVAQKYLKAHGYVILEVNFMCRFGEIDIIALKDNVLIFVEVKARKNTDFGYPREYVTQAKIRKIISTAKYFLLKKQYDNVNCRFDVIEIIYDRKTINHLENVFEV
ncbi:YraN family protein [Sedimentibacter sp. zth1]|uniref:YraN family protein n=1 Tax=Sedimentibacter sp. zth1 TaxID=2816908 RepID=UPI001A9159F6|nr:YraN family protein [Sedimentibacter sp. zth1]QSX06564.1 YraN family protein [Sedimentibacter sp. zth1]